MTGTQIELGQTWSFGKSTIKIVGPVANNGQWIVKTEGKDPFILPAAGIWAMYDLVTDVPAKA